ncbi:MAG: alpha/beta hydrolase [Pseudomonadota bacterium]
MKRSGFILLLVLIVLSVSTVIHSAIYTARVESRFPETGLTLQINAVDAHVITAGMQGKPVLLIHGAGANARDFPPRLISKLSEQYRVFVPDRPGHGYSRRPKNAAQLAVQARQMAGVLEQLAPGETAVIVGHSYGSAVALRLALDKPELVAGLVLIAPVPFDWGPGHVAWHDTVAATPVLGTLFSHLMPIFGPSQARAGLSQSFAPAPEPQGHYDQAGIDLMFRPQTFRANAKDLAALGGELALQQDRYGELDMPVVIFSGAADQTIDSTQQAERLRREHPRMKLISFEDEGHFPHYRKAEVLLAEIEDLAAASDTD